MKMKTIPIMTIAVSSALVLSCGQSGQHADADITGSYSRVDTGQFSILHQTVEIRPLTGTSADQYRVTTRSVTDYLDDTPDKRSERTATGVYDSKAAIMTTDKQQTYAFDHATGKLRLNQLEFTRQ